MSVTTMPAVERNVAPGLDALLRRMLCATMPARSGDEALALAFAAHDRAAFEQAYRRYAALLYSAAYNVLGESQDAQDCVHDALARVWRSPHAYSAARGSLSSFLTVCVRNEAISRHRSQQRRMRMEQRLAAEPDIRRDSGCGSDRTGSRPVRARRIAGRATSSARARLLWRANAPRSRGGVATTSRDDQEPH